MNNQVMNQRRLLVKPSAGSQSGSPLRARRLSGSRSGMQRWNEANSVSLQFPGGWRFRLIAVVG